MTIRQVGQIVLLIPFIIFAIAIVGTAANNTNTAPVNLVPDGNPEQGPQAIQTYGCGACHTIRGVVGAMGKVGPDLTGVASRSYLAGTLPNTPDNLVNWIEHPQSVLPGNDMPDTGITDAAARDIAAYLYSLR
jgi:cytochrome c